MSAPRAGCGASEPAVDTGATDAMAKSSQRCMANRLAWRDGARPQRLPQPVSALPITVGSLRVAGARQGLAALAALATVPPAPPLPLPLPRPPSPPLLPFCRSRSRSHRRCSCRSSFCHHRRSCSCSRASPSGIRPSASASASPSASAPASAASEKRCRFLSNCARSSADSAQTVRTEVQRGCPVRGWSGGVELLVTGAVPFVCWVDTNAEMSIGAIRSRAFSIGWPYSPARPREHHRLLPPL